MTSGVDLVERMIDHGIVIDRRAFVPVEGLIDLQGLGTRVVVASIQTHLNHSSTIESAQLPPARERDKRR